MSIPGAGNPLLLGGAGGYKIERSLRFNSADSTYLSRLFGTATTASTFTFSFWIKRSTLGGTQYILSASTNTGLLFETDLLSLNINGLLLSPSAKRFRDPSAWYHVTWAQNGATQTLYANGELLFSGAILQSIINTAVTHQIGSLNNTNYFSGYLADVNFIDGQALAAGSFGETDANGIWQPKAYTGTYGTNGFKLAFADNSAATATTLGKDTSGNGNNWTPNNLSVTAGAGNDSLVGSPTNYGTDTGAGGEVRGNYCTWNALAVGSVSDLASRNGNLDATGYSVAGYRNKSITATIGVSSGKWYWEVALTSVTSTPSVAIGISSKSNPFELGYYPGDNAFGWSYYAANGYKVNAGTSVAYGASYTAGDLIGVALDADNGTLTFYKNGTSQGTAYTGLTSGPYYPAIGHGGSTQAFVTSANFGQRPFAYTAPSGFKALCTQNLPAPTITKPSTVMDVKLYTGNGSTQTISGLGFSPDLVWIKARNQAYHSALFDVIRGTGKILYSSLTNAEENWTNSLTAFNSDGFSLGADSSFACNTLNTTHVAWTWDAGSSTVTNTDGSITSQVRANASAGFSIVTYTGTGVNATVGHGLNAEPYFIICKARGGATGWLVYHRSITNAYYLVLNGTDASTVGATAWQNTNPTSTVFSIGTGGSVNGNGITQLAYCFAPVAGYSAFGSYTGNGSADGPFVYTGFRPRWVMIKCSNTAASWITMDSARATNNGVGPYLFPNLSDAENSTGTVSDLLDLNSNGFKLRGNYATTNSTAATYVYAAFAEAPFAYSRAR